MGSLGHLVKWTDWLEQINKAGYVFGDLFVLRLGQFLVISWICFLLFLLWFFIASLLFMCFGLVYFFVVLFSFAFIASL